MPTLAEIRQQFPQYQDLSDQQLAEGLHKAYYSDLPFREFAGKIGYKAPAKSFDAMADGSLVPSQNVHYTGSGPVDASSGIAQREKKYGTNAGFNFGVKPENVQDVRKSLSPLGRGAYNAVTSIPGLAADAGVSLRNMLTGENYQSLTQLTQPGLDRALPMPNVPGDKTLEILTSIAAGSQMPFAPSVRSPAPKDFLKPAGDLVRQQTLAAGQKEGLVVPPSTTNPTLFNRFMESLGGKIGTQQDAAIRNQGFFNTAAKKALGLSEDAPLTQESLAALRREAGDAYETLRGTGQVVADGKYADDLAAITSKFTGASKDFPKLAKNEIAEVVEEVSKKEFSSDSAVDLLAILRDKADKAFAGGDKGLGKAYKSVSKAIEDLFERNLTQAGKPDLVKQFKDARALIAKSYSVEKAFNPATGNVVGNKLAAQLNKNAPLSGDLKLAGRWAQAFPKVSNAVDDSGSVRNTDVILGGGAAAVSKEPGWLLYPFARQAARAFMLSQPGQKLAVPSAVMQPSPEQVLAALMAAEQARKSAGQ